MVYVHLEGTISIWLFTHHGFSSFWLVECSHSSLCYYSSDWILFDMTLCRAIVPWNLWRCTMQSDFATIVWISLACFEIRHVLKVSQICFHLLTKFVAFSAGILSSRSSRVVTCLPVSVQLFYAEYLLIPFMRWFSCTILRPTWCVRRSPAKRFKFPLKQALLQSAASTLHLLQGTSFVSILIVASQ